MVLPHVINLGYGAALETGYMYAAERGYDVVLQMDGDGQHLAEELPALLQPVKEGSADVVIGSRHLAENNSSATPPIRRIGQRIFQVLVFCLTRFHLSDPTSGFQALSKRAVFFLTSGVFPCDYPDADVIVMAHLSGLRIREVPVRMLESSGKSMHSGLSPLYYGIKMLLSMFVVLLNYGRWAKWRRRIKEV